MTELTTARLRLSLQGMEVVREQVANMPEDVRKEVSAEWLRMVTEATEASPWIHGFDAELTDGTVIGGCGYKGPPADGMVEIAYWVAEEHRGKGYATEQARALAEFGLAADSVTVVRAHTLPEKNASTSVLTKAGFQRTGQVIDPDDGPVWRWEFTGGTE